MPTYAIGTWLYGRVAKLDGDRIVVDVDTDDSALRRVTLLPMPAYKGPAIPEGTIGSIVLQRYRSKPTWLFSPLANTPAGQSRALEVAQALQRRRLYEVCGEALGMKLVPHIIQECGLIAQLHQDKTGEDLGLDHVFSEDLGEDLGEDLDEEDALHVLRLAVKHIEARLAMAATVAKET